MLGTIAMNILDSGSAQSRCLHAGAPSPLVIAARLCAYPIWPKSSGQIVKLPHAEQATISPAKIANYLLSPVHPQGRFKAVFFRAMGFSREDSAALAMALRQHAMTLEIIDAQDTLFGTRYIIDGPLTVPSGRPPLVRTVWIVGTGQTIPRFVTAYPL